MKHVIDAKNQKLGRIASQVAKILIGKDTAEFARNIVPNVQVEVINASALDFSEKKKGDKYYLTYSGYPGGQKKEKLGDLIERRGVKEVVERAVYGMLPKNKLRSEMIKGLTVKN